MTRFHRSIFRTNVYTSKEQGKRQAKLDKKLGRSFYESRACPDRDRSPEEFRKWQPIQSRKAAKRAARKAKKRLRRARETLDRIAPAPKRRSGFHVNSAQTAHYKPVKPKTPFLPMSEILKRYAAKLNGNFPVSEKWFLALYKEHGLLHASDKFNEPFADVCIPDIVNHELRYIIEVQDPTHKKTERIIRDAKKNVLFAKSGYRAFYVWAWDHASFDAFLSIFKEFLRIKRTPVYVPEPF